MKSAEALRDRLKQQIADLQMQLAGVEMTLRAMRGESTGLRQKPRAGRSNVKQLVLKALEEARSAGVNAQTICDAAERRGETVERGTVSSLLSRLKGEHIVTYEGGMYRLTHFSGSTPPIQPEGAPAVH